MMSSDVRAIRLPCPQPQSHQISLTSPDKTITEECMSEGPGSLRLPTHSSTPTHLNPTPSKRVVSSSRTGAPAPKFPMRLSHAGKSGVRRHVGGTMSYASESPFTGAGFRRRN